MAVSGGADSRDGGGTGGPTGTGGEPGGTGGAQVSGGTGGEPGGTGGAGGVSTGGSTTGTGGRGSLVGSAFDVQIPLDENEYDWCAGACAPATLLVTRATDDAIEAVWGSTGRVQRISLSRGAEGWTLDEALLLGTESTWEYAMCASESSLITATFVFADTDGDGALDLTITGQEQSRFCSDDYSTTSDSEVVLTGRPDDRVPELDSGVTLLGGASLVVDKPLVDTATCALVPEDPAGRVPLTPRVMGGYVVGFDTDVTLPLGMQYTTECVGDDFAGVGTPIAVEVATHDDFGVLTDGSFESGATDGWQGGEIVDAYGVPAINGQAMLLARAGEVVALHLQRSADEQSLVLDARMLDYCGYGGSGTFPIAVAVVGHDTVFGEAVAIGEGTAYTVSTMSVTLGELQHIEIPLQGSGTDVLVRLEGENYGGAGCNRTGVLVDDVRLE